MPERRRRTASVRFRVTALAAVVVAIVLAATAAALVLHQRRVMTETLDESLELEADAVERDLATGKETLGPVVDDDGIGQVVRAGEVVAATASFQGRRPIAVPPDAAGGDRSRTIEGLVEDEPRFRVLSRHVDTPVGPATLHVGASMEDVEEATARLGAALAVAFPLVVAILAVLVWVLVGRTLAPVEHIRVEVAAIRATALHRRVPEPAGDDEIGRLARTMNAMLDRLEESSRRQQQFVADASHELRSPLTRIRSEVEVDLTHAGDADLVATHRSVLAEAAELERLLDDLLALARADAGPPVVDSSPVDLDDIVLRHVRRVRANGRVDIDAAGVSGAQVIGDGRELGRAVGNLVDNAVRHAAATVTITLAESDGEAVLTVADDGPGVPAGQRERIFERFTRIDDARTRDAGGTGLGLAITRAIVTRHHGVVYVDPEHQGGARLVVRLPLGGG